MICSTMNFDRFMSGPLQAPGSSIRWRSYRGAQHDDVVQPFDRGELSARIRAHAQRGRGLPETRIAVAGLEVNRGAARLWRHGSEVRLTAREWAMFDALIEGNAVEVYVSRLRTKLGPGGTETRRGPGYVAR